MAELEKPLAEELARVLAEHTPAGWSASPVSKTPYHCKCGHDYAAGQHSAHQAEALAPVVSGALAQAEQRGAAKAWDVLLATGNIDMPNPYLTEKEKSE